MRTTLKMAIPNSQSIGSDFQSEQLAVEKPGVQVQHHEGLDYASESVRLHHGELIQAGFELDTDELPKGYFTSSKFLGTFLGIGMNLMGSTAGFAIIAPVLGQIDVAIGPGPVICEFTRSVWPFGLGYCAVVDFLSIHRVGTRIYTRTSPRTHASRPINRYFWAQMVLHLRGWVGGYWKHRCSDCKQYPSSHWRPDLDWTLSFNRIFLFLCGRRARSCEVSIRSKRSFVPV